VDVEDALRRQVEQAAAQDLAEGGDDDQVGVKGGEGCRSLGAAQARRLTSLRCCREATPTRRCSRGFYTLEKRLWTV